MKILHVVTWRRSVFSLAASGDSEGVSQHCRLTERDFSALFTVIPALQLQQRHAQEKGKCFSDLRELGRISVTARLLVKESKTKDAIKLYDQWSYQVAHLHMVYFYTCVESDQHLLVICVYLWGFVCIHFKLNFYPYSKSYLKQIRCLLFISCRRMPKMSELSFRKNQNVNFYKWLSALKTLRGKIQHLIHKF